MNSNIPWLENKKYLETSWIFNVAVLTVNLLLVTYTAKPVYKGHSMEF
jgi:hypothetical protein